MDDEKIMETNMETNNTEPNEVATPAVMSRVTHHAGKVSPMTGRRTRRRLRLGVGWRFTRHLLEMVAAMIAGMVVLMIYRRDRYTHEAHGHRS
jgi:hypothetical protein